MFLTYVLSFVYLGIYWNNHHHLLQAVDRVNGGILWANLHLLFWLSLVPFVTGWMGEHGHAACRRRVYGVVLLCAGIAYSILIRVIIHAQGPHSKLKAAVGGDVKGNLSVVMYAAGDRRDVLCATKSRGPFTRALRYVARARPNRIERVLSPKERPCA